MKTRLLLFAIFIFQFSFSQTSIPGGYVNGNWSLAGSPYNIQGSIQVANGDSLIIQPGVKVNFQGAYKFLVLGKLKAIGTIVDTITFTAANTSIGWRGIRFDNTNIANDSSKIIYCKLQYGRATGAAPDNNGGALYFSNFSKVKVSHSCITNCSANTKAGGIFISASNPIITYNTIRYNTVSGSHDGGGIAIFASSPLVSNNSITNNSSTDGGGIYIESGNPTITSNTISNNNAVSGGGINNFNGNANISNNAILTNSASLGGGISVDAGNPSIANNTISGNFSQNTGGGISTHGNSNSIILNNVISKNISTSAGGGLECYSTNATIRNNFICNNTVLATGWNYLGGGGIWCVNSSPAISISNNVIANNNATNGGGLLCYNASPTCVNNTIVNNNAGSYGGALSCSGGNPVLTNCILYGNTAGINGAQVYLYDEPSDPNFYYCDVEGGVSAFELNGNFYTGVYQNNINAVPQFVSPSAASGTSFNGLSANWSLKAISPCINSGNPIGTYPATDIAGNTRVYGSYIDMGAYEFQSVVGIKEFDEKNIFSIYPNPTSGKLSIWSSMKILSVEIIDGYGEKIYQSNDGSTDLSIIDLTSFSSGVYFMQIKSEEGVGVKKIIVSR